MPSRPTRTASAIQQDAETYRNDVVPRARGEAAKEMLDAEAYRLQVLALAQGETSRFDQVLAQYEHAPAVTRERMYLETMENVYKNSRKVIVDTKNGGNMLYLPLDKLISAGTAIDHHAERHAHGAPRARPKRKWRPPRIRRVRAGCADANQDPVYVAGAGRGHPAGARQRIHGQ